MSFTGAGSENPSSEQVGAAAIFGGPAALGGLAGQQKDVQTQTYQVEAPTQTALGIQSEAVVGESLAKLLELIKSQEGATSGAPAQYAKMLQDMIQSGGLPSEKQIGSANQFAANIFAPQQAALNNAFTQAGVDTARTSAQLGRSVDDPILAAKLAQYKGQQQNVLSGQQTALGSQLALQLPREQLGYSQALAAQALQNRQALLGLGSNIMQNQQNYGLSTAKRTTTGIGGGGLKGAFSGFMGGLTLGMQGTQAAQGFTGFGGGGDSEPSSGGSGGGIGSLAGLAMGFV